MSHTHTTIDNNLTVNGTVRVDTGTTNSLFILNPNLTSNGKVAVGIGKSDNDHTCGAITFTNSSTPEFGLGFWWHDHIISCKCKSKQTTADIYLKGNTENTGNLTVNGKLTVNGTITPTSGTLTVGGTLTATSVELNNSTVIVSPMIQITPTVNANTYKYVFPISIANASVSFEFKLSDGTQVTINAVPAPRDDGPVTVTISGGTDLFNYIKYYDSTFTMEISFKEDVTVSQAYPVTSVKINLLTQLTSQQSIINNLTSKIDDLETRIATLENPT